MGRGEQAERSRRGGRGIRRRMAARILCGGLVLGAGLMYLLDPQTGRQRRAALRGLTGRSQTAGHTGAAQPPNGRADAGIAAPTADEALARQVCQQVERTASHPELITATASDGIVTLRGSVPAGELKPLLRRVADVRGIELIENRLEVK